MKKTAWIPLLLAALLLLSALSGCSPSPTAVTVGNRKVDASEFAFYLNYNRIYSGAETGTIAYDAASLEEIKETAISQIVANEVVRLKCEEFQIKPPREKLDEMKANKEEMIASLGGKAGYLDYLKQSCLTDRAYDKFQENMLYSDLLYDYMQEDSRAYFTDENLRQFFSEYYATVKCICISLIDDEGNPLSASEQREKRELAQDVLDLATAPDADFDALMEQYNEDPALGEGYPISRMEAEATDHFGTLFDLEENQVSDLLREEEGIYILKRCPVAVTFYDEYLDEISQTAMDWRFNEKLSEWLEEYPVTVEKIVDKMDLNNLATFVK